MKAFGRAAAFTDLTILVKNSAGSTIATLDGFTATNSWKSVSFNLPATLAKYDVHFYSTNPGARVYLYALCIWEQD